MAESPLEQIARIMANAAGWKKPEADALGIFHFSLEGSLTFELVSFDGRNAIIRGEVCSVPESNQESQELLRNYAKKQVAACRKRASVLALEKGGDSLPGTSGRRLILYRIFRMGQEEKEILHETESFLNDLAWWKKDQSAQPTPFSFGMSSFFGGVGGAF